MSKMTVWLVVALVPILTGMIFSTAARCADQTTVDFDEITFASPGTEWQGAGAEIGHEYLWRDLPEPVPWIRFTRKTGGSRFIRLTLEAITFPATLQGHSEREIASSFFGIQKKVFAAEIGGRDFVEGDRMIAGRQFPSMSFRSPALHMSAVDVLYFSEGLEAKGKFYRFFWADVHSDDQPPSTLDTLDSVVSSVKMRP